MTLREISDIIAEVQKRRTLPAYVVVHLARNRDLKPTRGSGTALTGRSAKRVLTEHGGVLLRGSPDQNEQSEDITTIVVPDMTRANKLAAALREIEGIETAYAKPAEELP